MGLYTSEKETSVTTLSLSDRSEELVHTRRTCETTFATLCGRGQNACKAEATGEMQASWWS